MKDHDVFERSKYLKSTQIPQSGRERIKAKIATQLT